MADLQLTRDYLVYLRAPAEKADGSIVYRCASEPVHMYLKKGGTVEETVGRKCLCNALFANIGMPQRRKGGYVEEPALTLGQELVGAEGLQLAASARPTALLVAATTCVFQPAAATSTAAITRPQPLPIRPG